MVNKMVNIVFYNVLKTKEQLAIRVLVSSGEQVRRTICLVQTREHNGTVAVFTQYIVD